MKRFEINAFSLEEAKAKAAEMGLTVVRNVIRRFEGVATLGYVALGGGDLDKYHIHHKFVRI